MSKTRSKSLSALPTQPPISSLEIRATTDLNFSQRALQPAQQRGLTLPRRSTPDREEPEENDLAAHTEWTQKNLLTCDGGGIRGYATVLMLEALMKHIGELERRHETPHYTSFFPHDKPRINDDEDDGSYVSDYLPCHYFDYMVGTSTGGLIAVMLSRWRMSVRECLRKYEVLGQEVFGHRRKISVLGIPHNKHHKGPLIQAIQEIANLKTPERSRGSDPKFLRFPAPSDLCRTAVFANEETKYRATKGPYIFRSYLINIGDDVPMNGRPLNYTLPINQEIWEVCRATTAAPTFFRPQVIGDRVYSDGGVGTNNPSLESIDEFHKVHQQYPRNVVSFGTGKPARDSKTVEDTKKKLHITRWFDLGNELLKTAKAGLTDCEKTHGIVEGMVRRDANFRYFRFNIEEGLGKMKIDECKPTTLDKLRTCTRAELAKPEVQNNLRTLAQDLVNQRRYRIEHHRNLWGRFACCTSYECGSCLNESSERLRLRTRTEMTTHLQMEHSIPNEDRIALKRRLDWCRRPPEFPAGPW